MTKINKKNIQCITIATSALNEEGIINSWIKSVLMQNEENYKIENIIIHSDGSTDKTAKIINDFKDPRIVFHDHKKREGKSARLNEIFHESNSDLLILSDADMVMSHNNVIRDVLHPLLDNSKVMMTGGNIIPVPPKTFTEFAALCTVKAYLNIRNQFKGGNNMFSATGGLLAYRKEFYKSIKIPKSMIGDDVFTYFLCLSKGYLYRYVESAIVEYRLPQTLKDYINQRTRSTATRIRQVKYFGKKIIGEEYAVPKLLKYGYMIKVFINHPLHCVYIFIINIYCTVRAYLGEKNMDGKWEMIVSSKRSLKNEVQ